MRGNGMSNFLDFKISRPFFPAHFKNVKIFIPKRGGFPPILRENKIVFISIHVLTQKFFPAGAYS